MSKPPKKAPAADAQPDAKMVQFMADLEQSLQEAHAGLGRVTTPTQIATRRRGRPVGSVQATTKEAVKLRLDADVLAALRASGDGWQTRVNDTLRASLHLAGRV
ncbi:MAG: hypothetical protein RLZZ352_2606 [Pseudomonadota bacterium]|jgi:uncharacterized protein (DUF4415 family)